MLSQSKSDWYVVRLTSAARWQWAQGEVAELGYSTYCPLEVNSVWNPRTRKYGRKSRPLIDGYLFVQVPDGRFDRIKALPEVASFLGWDRPRSAPHARVAELMGLELAGAFDRAKPKKRYVGAVGDRVKITGGPYSGFTAKIHQAKSGAARVKVILDFFGTASVSVDDLVKLEAA